MKQVIFLILVTLISGHTKAQQASLETIECLGETIVTVQGNDVKSSSNGQNASIFTVNMKEKTLTIKSISRFNGIQQDEFVITKKTTVGGKDIYDLANPSTADKNKYGLSIDNSNAVLNIFSGSRTITITSTIIKRYNTVVEKQKNLPATAAFQKSESDPYIHFMWSQTSDSIIIYSQYSGENKMRVKYVERGSNGITINVIDSHLDSITIDNLGKCLFGTYIQNEYTLEEIFEAIEASYMSMEEYENSLK